MQLQDYARILIKRGWIIVLMVILTTLSAIVFSKLQTPIYKSTIALSAVPSRPADWGQSQAIKNLLRLYVQQMQSPIMIQPVVDKLQLDVSPDKFVSQVNLSADEATLVITIEARHELPEVAAKMAQTLAEAFVSQHEKENLEIDQRDRILVKILYNATSPGIFSPKTSVNALAGAILGGLIGLLVVFVLEWLESDIVRTPDDLERHIGVTVLGAIPTISADSGKLQVSGSRFQVKTRQPGTPPGSRGHAT
jgi:capsular polysaccharide biosynthesis protein